MVGTLTVGLSPSDAALRMVRLLPGLEHADRIPSDVDVERLAACLGFHVRGGAMRGNDCGMLCRPREITIERFTYGMARRFTVAHMLAHLLLHPDRPVDVEHGVLCHVRDFGPDATGEERWANRFATVLTGLMVDRDMRVRRAPDRPPIPRMVSDWLDSLNLLPSEGCALMWIGGSHAYGLADKDSDVDVRAVAFPTLTQVALMEDWGERHMPDADTVLRSARKTLAMMRNGNPNLIELYGLPDDCMIHVDEWGSRLLDVGRRLMFTRKLISSFAGYATQQKHLSEHCDGTKRDKALMHSLRAWRMGAELLETGEVHVRRDVDGMELKAIRLGEYDPDWYETAWTAACTRFREAEEHSTLPAPVSDVEYRSLVEPLMLDWMRHLLDEGEM